MRMLCRWLRAMYSSSMPKTYTWLCQLALSQLDKMRLLTLRNGHRKIACSYCIAAGVGKAFSRVCLSVCPRSEKKTACAINTKLGTHIVYSSRSACSTQKTKGQRSRSHRKTVTVARLLVTRAPTAVYSCCRCWSANRYDCLCFLV